MSKRFIETDIFEREFFFDLKADEKLLYIYFLLNCDSIGVVEYNRPLTNAVLKINMNMAEFIRKVNGNIVKLTEKRYFIPKYCLFQYGIFNETKQHRSLCKKLFQLTQLYDFIESLVLGLYKDSISSLKTPYKETKIKTNTKINTKINKKTNTKFTKPNIKEIEEYCKEIDFNLDAQQYLDSNVTKGWVVGKNKTPMKDWKASIRTWQRNAKKYDIDNDKTIVLDNYEDF